MHDLFVQYNIIGDEFLEGLDPRKYCHGVDNAVDPDGFNWSQVLALDLVLNVVDITFMHEFFPKDLSLELFFLAVVQVLELRDVFIQQHLAI